MVCKGVELSYAELDRRADRLARRLRSLGLRKIHQQVVREDTPVVRGMVDTVRHLVTVEEVE